MERVTIGEAFLNLNLDKSVKIIDVACGIGNVAAELVAEGYDNIDGLDPVKGYLEVAKQRNLYKNYFKLSVDPDRNLPIDNDTYDVVLCCAGFFDGLMSPRVFPELIRITKPKGEVFPKKTRQIITFLDRVFLKIRLFYHEQGSPERGNPK